MKILSAEFVKSCEQLDQFPKDRLPAVAFIGRSNVGKSSLINSLLRRKGLARVSRTPGKTQMINVFLVTTDDPKVRRFYAVDLPGYGYAKVAFPCCSWPRSRTNSRGASAPPASRRFATSSIFRKIPMWWPTRP